MGPSDVKIRSGAPGFMALSLAASAILTGSSLLYFSCVPHFLDIPFLRVVIFYNPSYIKNDFTDFSKHSRKEPPQACSDAPFNNQIQYSHFSKNPHQRLVLLFLLSHGRWACIAEHVEASKPQYCVKVISTGGSWACRRAQWSLKHYSKRKI